MIIGEAFSQAALESFSSITFDFSSIKIEMDMAKTKILNYDVFLKNINLKQFIVQRTNENLFATAKLIVKVPIELFSLVAACIDNSTDFEFRHPNFVAHAFQIPQFLEDLLKYVSTNIVFQYFDEKDPENKESLPHLVIPEEANMGINPIYPLEKVHKERLEDIKARITKTVEMNKEFSIVICQNSLYFCEGIFEGYD